MNTKPRPDHDTRAEEAQDAQDVAMAALLTMPDDVPWEEPKRAPVAVLAQHARHGYTQEAQPLTSDDADPAGIELEGALAINFMLAGNATVTFVSKKTLKRFTFKLRRPDDEKSTWTDNYGREHPVTRRPIWISVLSGPSNETDYAYLGTLWENAQGFEYAVGKKSRVDASAPSQHAAHWLAKALTNPALLEQCEVWHEGRCGRCGRKLTVPSSIASGIGPECATRM